jgi:PST family polysaccharide transporter
MSSIKATAVRGASWTIAAGFTTRILTLVASVVITHFVDPVALGDVGAAAIFTQTAASMTSFGMGQYLIANKEQTRDDTFHVTVLNFTTVAIVVVLAFFARVPLGKFLNVADSASYLPWLLGTFVIERASFIPERLLIRQLEFRRIAIARSAGDLVYGVSAIGFAMLGWGGYALIVGNVVRSVLKAGILTTGVSPAEWLTPAALHKKAYARIFRFGLPIAGQGLLLNASSRWDNLAFAYLFGAAPMARYNVAYTLADVPADQVGEQIAEVMLPSFARMTPAERDGAVVEVTGLTAILIFPLSIGLGAVAPTLVQTILPPEWYETGGMLTVLAALSLVRPLAWQANAYFIAVGTPRLGLFIDALKLVLLFAAMFALARFGQIWTCAAVGIAFGAALSIAWWVISRKINQSLWTFYRECFPALTACAIMAAAVLCTRWGFARTGIHFRGVGLALEVLAGAVAYVAALPVVARESTKKLVDLIKHAYRTRTQKA